MDASPPPLPTARHTTRRRLGLGLLCLLECIALPVWADRRENGFDLRAEAWHPPARQFRGFDGGGVREHYGRPSRPHWNSGYWYNGHHGDRHGWWWVVGSLWYFYPNPVEPVPNYPYEQNVTIIQTPPAPQPNVQTSPGTPNSNVWYYCEGADEYYPYLRECPGGWRAVPAKPADLRR